MKDKQPIGYPKGISRKDKMHVRNMVNQVRDFTKDSHLSTFWKGRTVVVSCSSGIDSTCLADIMYRVWRIAGNNPVHVVYVNHNLRPAENKVEIELLEKFSKERDLKFSVLDGKVSKGKNLQDRARQIRYEALSSFCQANGYNHVFIAHNKNDVYEGMMIKLFQGRVDKQNGVRIVYGLRPRHITSYKGFTLYIYRPLLDLTREDVERYMRTMDIPWHEDSSNATDAYLRNYIRHHVIPHTFLGNNQNG